MSDAAQTHEQSLQETACVDIHDKTEPGCCLLWNIHTCGVLKTYVLIGGAFIHIEAVKNIKKQNSLLYLQLVGWTFLERWACTSFWKRDGRVILFSGLNTRKDNKDDRNLLVSHCSIQTFTLMCCDPAADVILMSYCNSDGGDVSRFNQITCFSLFWLVLQSPSFKLLSPGETKSLSSISVLWRLNHDLKTGSTIHGKK